MYPDTTLYIDGAWCAGVEALTIPVLNPATGQAIGSVAHATQPDLDRALTAAQGGFVRWRRTSAFDRSKLMRAAAAILRERAESIAEILTTEQGKPVAEARMETLAGADIIDWFAEEARRAYGRVIPPRAEGIYQLVVKEPVGPVAAFTPWNFPINQAVRKISAAVATGCSIVIKGPEDTPAACAELVRAFADAGLPPGVVNLVYGEPAVISEYLITHPVIRKISFTGSTVVGKHLAMLAGKHMKRATMELGGHAPAIVFEDADLETAVRILCANKFRNAGQVCVAPTRFLIQNAIYEEFVDKFVTAAKTIKVGDGLAAGTTMGPLAHGRRIQAMEAFIADAVQRGATVRTGARRIGNSGFFFEPTVLTDVAREARVMNEEPFGPVALMAPFGEIEEAVSEANRLPYGLASYAYTRSLKTANAIAASVEAGMMSINHHGIALPEVPFGGVKESGYGSEGGSEAIEPYLVSKFVSQASL